MKVLLIGQLPKEIGGNYTTGAANVVYELSKQHVEGVEIYTYGTNISTDLAEKASSYLYQYNGYAFRPLQIILRFFLEPGLMWSHICHYKKVDHQNIFRFSFYEDNIRSVIKRIQPDLIHVHAISNVSPVRFALGNKKIPVLLTCHGIFYRGNEDNIVARDRHIGNIYLADYYSGLTKESLDEYESILGISKDKVAIIPNGVDCKKFFFSLEQRVLVRKEMSVNDDCKVFVTVASVQDRKGQLAFLKILEMTNLNYQYWIIGKGPDEKIINEFIQLHNLQSKVKLLGYKTASELYKYYSAADIYAHSSWKEGQALSELEANATGLRTVVNKAIVGTIAADLISSDYYVMDFNHVESDSFTKWVMHESLNRISKTNFDWSVIAKKYADLYRNILLSYNLTE